MTVKIPFHLDRTKSESLVRQMTDQLRDAIEAGFYKPGGTLPTIHEWARALEVSIRVPVGALANLKRERLVVSRPRHGCMVAPMNRQTWRGRVLMVRPVNAYSRFVGEQLAAVEEQLARADYLVTTIVVRGQDDDFDFAMLDAELRRRTNLVVVFGDQQPILRRVAKSGVPYVDFTADAAVDTPSGCAGHVTLSSVGAHVEFVGRCVRAGVRRVAVVAKAGRVASVVAMLEDAGVAVDLIAVDAEFGRDRGENLERETSRALDRLFAGRGRDWLPDLIYCVDDYQATGALFSLLGHGVEIPEDVRFVTVKNRGNGPAMSKSIACIQYDAAAVGRAAGQAAVRYLMDGRFALDADAIAPRYVEGDTFR